MHQSMSFLSPLLPSSMLRDTRLTFSSVLQVDAVAKLNMSVVSLIPRTQSRLATFVVMPSYAGVMTLLPQQMTLGM